LDEQAVASTTKAPGRQTIESGPHKPSFPVTDPELVVPLHPERVEGAAAAEHGANGRPPDDTRIVESEPPARASPKAVSLAAVWSIWHSRPVGVQIVLGILLALLAILVIALVFPALGRRISAVGHPSPTTTRFFLPATEPWPRAIPVINLAAGDTVTITALSGSAHYCPDCPVTPDGQSREHPAHSVSADWNVLAPGLWDHALIGKIGESGAPFNVGSFAAFTAATSGRLYCSINDTRADDVTAWANHSGEWPVTVTAR
jgi:hypothetical protein